jgi:hypothetical protein
MSLTTSGGLDNWMMAGPGMVWIGTHQATQEDIDEVTEYFKGYYPQGIPIEETTLCGTYSWKWQSSDPQAKKFGGLGSLTYETQLWDGEGVSFTESPIWYYNSAGAMVKGIPPQLGAYHWVDKTDNVRDAYEGPEPCSKADLYRGNGEFYWNANRLMYDVR